MEINGTYKNTTPESRKISTKEIAVFQLSTDLSTLSTGKGKRYKRPKFDNS